VLVAAGLLIIGYGLVVQAAPGPSAIWNGVLDSTLVTPSSGPGAIGQPVATRAVTLYLQRISANRVLRLPPGRASLADSLRPGDTLRAVVGYGRSQDTALALGITRNAAVLLDSAVVLRAARQRSSRIALVGGIVALLGAFGLSRRRQATPAT